MSDPISGIGVTWFGLVLFLLGLTVGGWGVILQALGVLFIGLGAWEWQRGWHGDQ